MKLLNYQYDDCKIIFHVMKILRETSSQLVSTRQRWRGVLYRRKAVMEIKKYSSMEHGRAGRLECYRGVKRRSLYWDLFGYRDLDTQLLSREIKLTTFNYYQAETSPFHTIRRVVFMICRDVDDRIGSTKHSVYWYQISVFSDSIQIPWSKMKIYLAVEI